MLIQNAFHHLLAGNAHNFVMSASKCFGVVDVDLVGSGVGIYAEAFHVELMDGVGVGRSDGVGRDCIGR